jgi:hypothetical protein
MPFNFGGLQKLQKDLGDAGHAFDSLNEHVMEFNPNDSTSVEVAMSKVDLAIQEIVGRYPGNNFVTQFGEQIRKDLHERILEKAAIARLNNSRANMAENDGVKEVLHQIQNSIADLQSSDYQTFERHAKKLARSLRSEELQSVVSRLVEGIDIETWIKEHERRQLSMVGSARLEWPDTVEGELGTVILLVEKFAESTDFAFNFSFTFFYNGSNMSANLRKMVGQVLVPFGRDFNKYVLSKLVKEDQSNKEQPSAGGTYINFNHSNIGALQTGANALANVKMNVSQPAYDGLAGALENLSLALNSLTSLPNHSKEEIIELVADSKSELAKEKPNMAKLSSFLLTIGSAVSLVSELKPAYDAVKAAAVALGIL